MPGAARKTANVVLGTAYGIATGIVVDTHVSRLSNRLDLSKIDDGREDRAGPDENDTAGPLDLVFPSDDSPWPGALRRKEASLRGLSARSDLLRERQDAMNSTRRAFIAGSAAAFAAELFGAESESASRTRPRETRRRRPAGSEEAEGQLLRYPDHRYRDQSVGIRLSPERGTGKTLEVPACLTSTASGLVYASLSTAPGDLPPHLRSRRRKSHELPARPSLLRRQTRPSSRRQSSWLR